MTAIEATQWATPMGAVIADPLVAAVEEAALEAEALVVDEVLVVEDAVVLELVIFTALVETITGVELETAAALVGIRG